MINAQWFQRILLTFSLKIKQQISSSIQKMLPLLVYVCMTKTKDLDFRGDKKWERRGLLLIQAITPEDFVKHFSYFIIAARMSLIIHHDCANGYQNNSHLQLGNQKFEL